MFSHPCEAVSTVGSNLFREGKAGPSVVSPVQRAGMCCLQAKFGDGLPENRSIAQALSQLAKFEGALAADYNSKSKDALGGDSFNRRVRANSQLHV